MVPTIPYASTWCTCEAPIPGVVKHGAGLIARHCGRCGHTRTVTRPPRERFRVTYDVTTEASAAAGDVEESGFAAPRGWKFPATDPGPHEMSLREALQTCGYSGGRVARGAFDDGGRGFYAADRDTNYRTGEDTQYAIHPPATITPASYARVARVLGIRRR